MCIFMYLHEYACICINLYKYGSFETVNLAIPRGGAIKFGYVHCDINLQNTLSSPNGDVKITDFSIVKRVGRKKWVIFGV